MKLEIGMCFAAGVEDTSTDPKRKLGTWQRTYLPTKNMISKHLVANGRHECVVRGGKLNKQGGGTLYLRCAAHNLPTEPNPSGILGSRSCCKPHLTLPCSKKGTTRQYCLRLHVEACFQVSLCIISWCAALGVDGGQHQLGACGCMRAKTSN